MSNKLEEFYVALEDRFRGGADLIRERQQVYVPVVQRSIRAALASSATLDAVFLDIGCGRGEWLSLLRDHQIPCRGVDMNAEMVRICQRSGHDAVCANALEYLKTLPDGSLLGVSAFHVVEHLDLQTSLDLLTEIHRCLMDGGIAFFETPNPENLRVASHTFYIDPTHTKPVPPQLLAFMFEFSGFLGNEIVRLHPTKDFQTRWPMVGATGFMMHHFCTAQDYAVVGVKGAVPPGLLPAV